MIIIPYDGRNAFIKKLESQRRGFTLEKPHEITDPIIAHGGSANA